MLTFDNARRAPGGDDLSELFGALPDVVECGESNDYWVHVRRSTKQIELVSKTTGQVIAKFAAAGPLAHSYGLNPLQVGAAQAALKL